MNTKFLLSGIVLGAVMLPTITLGGSLTVSLIQGLSPAEAVQVLAEQIDTLTGRVEIIETKSAGQEQIISELQSQLAKEQVCRGADKLFFLLPPHSGEGIGRMVGPSNIVDLYNETIEAINHGSGDIRDLPIIEQYYQKYLSAKTECEK